MEQNSKARTLPFLTALARINNRYDIVIEKDDFIERAYYIWREIGNIATDEHYFEAIVDDDGIVDLPTDCEFVRSVVTTETLPNRLNNPLYGNYYYDSEGRNREVRPDAKTLSAESSVRISDAYQHGTTVAYETGDGFIKVKSPTLHNRKVIVRYGAVNKDSDGLPLLNDKEVEAIATMMALQEAERMLFMGKKGSDVLVQYLTPKAERAMAAAKSDEKINDDAMDKILDVKTSWDRKVYGRRFNPIK
jgi:hypothetical protein